MEQLMLVPITALLLKELSMLRDYYTQKVSMNYRDWTLRQFFEQMFNYCFPIKRTRGTFQYDRRC